MKNALYYWGNLEILRKAHCRRKHRCGLRLQEILRLLSCSSPKIQATNTFDGKALRGF